MAKLTKAPVFYVVAQVAHSPILKLESLVPDLQERLRKDGFPGYRMHRQVGFEVHANPEKVEESRIEHSETLTHVFASRDQTESIIVWSGSVAYQTVAYDTMEAFLTKFERGISAVRDVLAPDSFSRIGFRFLDAVPPPVGEPLEQYVRPQFLGLQQTLEDPWLAEYAFSEAVAGRDGRKTKVRVLTRDSPVTFPADLASIAPPLPQHVSEMRGVHALIDSDAMFGGDDQVAQEFGTSEILGHLRALKSDLDVVFRAVVTERAIKDWT